MRLRQVALVAKDLAPVADDLSAVLGVKVTYNDPGVGEFGLHNALWALDDTFLEVVSPKDANTTAERFMDRRGGDSGYMAIFQVDDLDAERSRIEHENIRVVWEVNHEDAATIHLHPRDVGGAIVSLDRMTPPESWRWAGPNWQNDMCTDVVGAIAGITVAADAPAELAKRWSRALNQPVVTNENGQPEIRVDKGVIRFKQADDGRGDGIDAVELVVNDPGRFFEAARARGLEVTDDGVRIAGAYFRPSATAPVRT